MKTAAILIVLAMSSPLLFAADPESPLEGVVRNIDIPAKGWYNAQSEIGYNAQVLGYLSSTAVLTMGILSAVIYYGDSPVYWGIAGTATLGVMGPIISLGSDSVIHGDKLGASAFQVAGWVLYGVVMVAAPIAINDRLHGGVIPRWMILGLSGVGSLSLLIFTLDTNYYAFKAAPLYEGGGATPSATATTIGFEPSLDISPLFNPRSAMPVAIGLSLHIRP